MNKKILKRLKNQNTRALLPYYLSSGVIYIGYI